MILNYQHLTTYYLIINTIPALHSTHYYDNPNEYKLTEEIIWYPKPLEEVWSTIIITGDSFYRIILNKWSTIGHQLKGFQKED